ncbi:hypothetical protein U9M48_001549 [Paspalum notatum var. saurae]|uniref:Uncharacterized protein n=1 Tax=Paspalum notatum var. saurae TaxID=547442 RepID=A0AAQ3PM73_PASNO
MTRKILSNQNMKQILAGTQESTVEDMTQEDKEEDQLELGKKESKGVKKNDQERRVSARLRKYTGVTMEEKNKKMAMKRNLEGLSKQELQEMVQAGIQALSQMTAALHRREEGPRRLPYHQDGGAGGNV